jgi:hypothetical protein
LFLKNRRFFKSFTFARKKNRQRERANFVVRMPLRQLKDPFFPDSVPALLDRLFNLVPWIDESVCPVVPRILSFPGITVRGRCIHVQTDHHLRVGLK